MKKSNQYLSERTHTDYHSGLAEIRSVFFMALKMYARWGFQSLCLEGADLEKTQTGGYS